MCLGFTMSQLHDHRGFPKLTLSNPRAQVLFPTGLYTYAFGNTPGVSLVEHLGTSENKHLDFLLLGSGDPRNVFFTISDLVQRWLPDRSDRTNHPESLSLHLNDYDPSIVARNVIILTIARTINPECDKDVDFLWNVWYCLALSDDESKRLREIIKTLASQNHATNEFELGSEGMLTECRKIWNDWLLLELDTETVSLQRQRFIVWGLNFPQTEQDSLQESCNIAEAATLLTNTSIKHLFTPLNEHKWGQKYLQKSGTLYQEMYSYFVTGSTVKICSSTKVNPTLIRPFEHKWKVHYGSCPFSGYNPVNRELLEKNRSLTKTCKAKLKTLVKDFQTFAGINPDNSRVKVTFWIEDALQLCRNGLPKDIQFDVIDTSNLSDHIGLLNILVCWGRRLKESGHSQLFTSTMLWSASGHSTLDQYLESSIGIHNNLLPTLLGLKLAEDLDLGKSDSLTAKEGWRVEDRLTWVKEDAERSPISIVRSPDILPALKAIADRCCRLPPPEKRCMQLSGVTLSSPTTFFTAFVQMAAAFKEPAEQVLSYVEESLPNVRLFQRRISNKLDALSWNVLKSAAGLLPDVVLQIEVQVTFPTSALARTTPVLQAVLFEDPTDARFLSVWPVSQLEQRRFKRPVHLFYNNVRYDHGVASFLVLEKDWECLHSDTVLVLLSFSADCKSDLVKVKHGRSDKTEDGCCLTNKRFDENGNIGGTKGGLFRKSRRKSGVKRNVSFLKVNCMSDKTCTDSCLTNSESYQLAPLPKHDLVIHNTAHMYNSRDCLLTEEKRVSNNEKCFGSGIISLAFNETGDDHQGKENGDDLVIQNGGYAKDKVDSDGHVTTTVERVENIREYFGLCDAWSALPVQQTRTDLLELLVLEEHIMCYNAEIRILKGTETTGLTVDYKPRELPTVVEISLNEEGTPLKLHFAAPVEETSSKVRVLETKQNIRCHFPKKEFGVCGQVCIKRPPTLNVSGLPRWRNKEDLAFLMDCSQLSGEETVPEERGAFDELQNVVESIIATFVECPEKNTCFTVHQPEDTEGTTPGLTIVVQEVYTYRELPLAKVLFCDHKVIAFPSKGVVISDNDMKYKAMLSQLMENRKESPMVNATQQGQILLRKLLYSNMIRVSQTTGLKPVWVDSLLQLRFGRMANNLGVQQCGFKNEREPSIKERGIQSDLIESSNQTSVLCDTGSLEKREEPHLLSKEDYDNGKNAEISPKNSGHVQEHERTGERCANCDDDSKNMKKCSRCKNVVYCNKACQRQHWKHHRPICTMCT